MNEQIQELETKTDFREKIPIAEERPIGTLGQYHY